MTLWLGIPSLTVEAQPLSSLPQRSELDLVIGDSIGTQPRFAVPDCLPLTSDSQTAAAAATTTTYDCYYCVCLHHARAN